MAYFPLYFSEIDGPAQKMHKKLRFFVGGF
jgi:hypothetical protein